jgi:hypothetical protein
VSRNQIRLFNIFRKEIHLSDASAEEAVYAMQELAGFAFDSKMNLLATKEVILLLKENLSSLKIEFSAKLDTEINSLRKDMQSDKNDLYKAIYLSGFLQFIAMIGTVLAVIKFIK